MTDAAVILRVPLSTDRCLHHSSAPGKASETAAICKSTSTTGPALTAAAVPAIPSSARTRCGWYSSCEKGGKGSDRVVGRARTSGAADESAAATAEFALKLSGIKTSDPTAEAALRLLCRLCLPRRQKKETVIRTGFRPSPSAKVPASRRRPTAPRKRPREGEGLPGRRVQRRTRRLLPVSRNQVLVVRLPIPARKVHPQPPPTRVAGRAPQRLVPTRRGVPAGRGPRFTLRPRGASWRWSTGNDTRWFLHRLASGGSSNLSATSRAFPCSSVRRLFFCVENTR